MTLLLLLLLGFAPAPASADISGSGCCGAACGSGCVTGCNDCATACGFNPCTSGSLIITSCHVVASCAGQPPFSFGGGGGTGGGTAGGGGGGGGTSGTIAASPLYGTPYQPLLGTPFGSSAGGVNGFGDFSLLGTDQGNPFWAFNYVQANSAWMQQVMQQGTVFPGLDGTTPPDSSIAYQQDYASQSGLTAPPAAGSVLNDQGGVYIGSGGTVDLSVLGEQETPSANVPPAALQTGAMSEAGSEGAGEEGGFAKRWEDAKELIDFGDATRTTLKMAGEKLGLIAEGGSVSAANETVGNSVALIGIADGAYTMSQGNEAGGAGKIVATCIGVLDEGAGLAASVTGNAAKNAMISVLAGVNELGGMDSDAAHEQAVQTYKNTLNSDTAQNRFLYGLTSLQ